MDSSSSSNALVVSLEVKISGGSGRESAAKGMTGGSGRISATEGIKMFLGLKRMA